MAYSQIETRGQFVRLLGLGTSGRNLTRRWEKNPTDAGAQRPGVFSLRRMLYLVVWQMTAVLYISDLDEVDWNRRLVVPRDELKPPVSPFLKVTASPAGLIWEMWDKRDWSWDAVLVVTGLGAGVASSATSSTTIMSSTWASVVPAGTVPKDTTTATSTASLPVLARRVLADPHEIGRFEGIGPDLYEWGSASTRASVGREPVTAEDCGSDCGGGVSNWARTPTWF